MTDGCNETHVIAAAVAADVIDVLLYCDLANGHAGPHQDRSMEVAVWWQKELTRKRDE